MNNFYEKKPTNETLWRSVILFGRNVATYKFALGKALLDLSNQEKTFIRLEELADPFSRYICEHLKLTDKQGTFSKSKFLDACRKYNSGMLKKEDLIQETVARGFQNVIDAFHVVNQGEISKRFYIDERKQRKGINITDDLLALKNQIQFLNLPYEVDARWRLVETAWSLGISTNLLEVKYDLERNLFYSENSLSRRIDITSSRDSLNGYQKGKCFYCSRDILIDNSNPDFMTDVDHFFPFILATRFFNININGVWNLVLSCMECNRGEKGKFARVPEHPYLEKLFDRNEYFISSHHPLRETIINQTGTTAESRRDFLQHVDNAAIDYLIHRWRPLNP